MDIAKRFGTNPQLEQEGVWVDLGDGARVRIARRDTVRYRETLRKESAPYRQVARAGLLSDETSNQILVKVLARTVLLDWEGITEDGQPVPYSYENAVRLLTTYRDFLEFVTTASGEAEAFKAESDRADLKNSSTP